MSNTLRCSDKCKGFSHHPCLRLNPKGATVVKIPNEYLPLKRGDVIRENEADEADVVNGAPPPLHMLLMTIICLSYIDRDLIVVLDA